MTGHNGCGKSTLLRIVSKLTDITSGKVIHHGNLKFNYIPEHFPKLCFSAREYIENMGRIEKLPIKEINHKAEKLFHNFNMDHMLDIQMKHLSKGSLQKVGVIQALLMQPDVLLLDEPLSGQDVDSQKYFIRLVNELKARGVAIVMSCHEMFLVNQVSDTAYRIQNHRLEAIDIDHLSNMDYDLLCFENSMEHKVSKLVALEVEKVEYSGLNVRLITKREKSNRVIFEMLKDGYQLRSMRGVDQ